ncbi:MAG: PD-(D/E)XK nuclease family protein [Rickettsiella sp.]|nr:PD-(D/E)XK nuclease family protein [Rickettsiella sp.]
MMEIYNKLFKILKHDDLILTPNKRLISFLHKSYATYQQTQNKIVWPSLLILQLEIWITLQWEKQLIQTSIYPYRLLTTNQERVIWQSIIEKSAINFLMPDQIAKTAQQTWQLCNLWQLDYSFAQFEQTSEAQCWKAWANYFISFCQEHACIDMTRATSFLIDLFRKKNLKPPSRLFLVGFDEISPQIKKLLQTLEQVGCEISQFSISEPKPCVRRLVLQNTEIELQTMARWAYQLWQAGKKNIICAIPNLLTIRSQVIATFTEVFTSLNPIPMETYPFNIAAGRKLSEFPIIQTALSIIQLKTIIPFNKISKLLRSPYLGYADDEQSSRAQLDIYCRRYLESTISLEQLIEISQQQHCQQLSQLLKQLISNTQLTVSKQLPSQWAVYFSKKIQILAWPGQRQLLSEEFQLIERWTALLEEFSTLDFILGEISEEVALQQLNYLVDDTLFQAKTNHEPSIHVLGFLDTAGLCVDNIWIMGLDDKSWPTTAHPNPFIPYILQRKQGLPHSSYERELYFASLLSQRLLNSAQTIVVSHSAQAQHSEQGLRPSALITSIPSIEISDLALPAYQTLSESIWATRSWEYYSDDLAPALQPHELTSVGSQLFKSQAACPFQAFALFRLKSHFYPFPQTGLNSIDRGILLHNVMETLWNLLTNQTTLLKQTDQSLQLLVKQSVTHAMKEFSKKRPFTFKKQFIEIEQERLQQRLMKLILLEKKRPTFNNVTHEKKENFTFQQLSLHLRIDRLDTLPDGSTVIIDYKTGTPTKFNWFEERLDEPQLALYCLSQPSAKGFAVIHIRSNTIEIQGFSEKENGLSQSISFKKDKSLPQNWSELLLFWKSALEKLAQQFQKGLAKVDPKQGTNTCRLCPLPLFCRVNHHEKSE